MYSAVILAGGFGTRLKPLTDTTPKPMLPVAGEPNLVRLCEHLCKNGFLSAVVTLKYLPEKIKEKLSDSCRGVDLYYSYEDEPLGTAGAVKAVSRLLRDDFLVISGDAVCTLDLAAAYEAHKKSGAAATIITHTVKKPLQYGVAVCDGNGRITAFCEKPSWQQVISDKANTGIYFLSKRALDYIPDGVNCDFARDVFPKMLDANEFISGYDAEGYWRDIGSFSEYLSANKEMMSGGGDAETEGSVFGDNFCLGKNSAFINSVAFDNVKISDNCSVVGSILARNVTVGDGCILRDGCVIGEGAVINDGVQLGAGTVIGTGKTVTKSRGDVIMVKNRLYSDGYVKIPADAEVMTELYRLGKAAAAVTDGVIGVCSDNTKKHDGEAEMLVCSLSDLGAQVYDFGSCTRAAAKTAGHYYGCKMTMFVTSDKDGLMIETYDDTGMPLSASYEKKIENSYRSETERKTGGTVERISGLPALYRRALSSSADLRGVSVSVVSGAESDGIERAFKDAGANTEKPSSPYTEKDEFTVNVSDGAALIGQNGFFCSFDSCLLILLSLIDPDAHPVVALPYFMPRVFEKTASRRGIKVLKYLCKPSYEQQADAEARAARTSCMFCHDPAFCAAALMSALHKNRLTLSDAAEKYAKGVVHRADITVPETEKASCMRRLYEAYMPYQVSATDGVSVVERDAEGVAMATDTDKIRIVISADSEEAAEDAVGEIMMRLGLNS